MKGRRTWEEMNVGERPLCFDRWPVPEVSPSTFKFEPEDEGLWAHSKDQGTARLFYRHGWTAVVFWNSDIYFTDEILTFDDMIDLIRSRFSKVYLSAPVTRDYVD